MFFINHESKGLRFEIDYIYIAVWKMDDSNFDKKNTKIETLRLSTFILKIDSNIFKTH